MTAPCNTNHAQQDGCVELRTPEVLDVSRLDARHRNCSLDAARQGEMIMLHVIIVGLIAGWLAGKLMNGYGYGALADIALGIIGGIVGGIIFRAFGLHPYHALGSITVATIGAMLLVAASRVLGDEF
jgi:uncharacterized membrane protein YeaQ/YmgE (transglycosylase-associated protein family)